ncbi:bifunctional lysylphosphatidylglycerol flippase/synthetase MprF [Novosphingobium barchaimii]|uniref:bifunctional lysylphosphatidylglycerol flippase/synthetase MprF n=1 Tax=Novosphingobium barchaimii TaxID=1420591 RepID=UPI0009E6C476|nr:bifunctional lysylphosphatidylglycerol flippase/synthetase MprF [Novosphingobium barchaimii]
MKPLRGLVGLIERRRRLVTLGVVLAVIALGFAALDALTHEIRYSQVRAAVHALTPAQIVLALGFTAASYLALTFYDYLALRIVGRPLPWRTAALASFTSYTLSHNLGLSLLTGGSARYRIYVAAGLDGPDVARVVALAAGNFWAGIITIAGAAMLLHPGRLDLPGVSLGAGPTHLAGAAMMAFMAALVIAAARAKGPLRVLGISLPVPRPGQIMAQIGIGFVDLSCAAAALFVLLPGAAPALLPAFVLAYALGIVVALISHVPGGLGVFEAVVLAIVPGDRTALFAALIAYRLVYYLLPLVLAALLLAWHESRRSRRLAQLVGGMQTLATSLSPLLLSCSAFLGGGMLLLSGSLPAIHARMGLLADFLPLPFIEASHIAASLVGTALLLLAPGLYRRLDGACLATRLLLVAGAFFSLTKGIDYEEAAACLGLAGLLQLTRGAFYRRTALTETPLTAGWLAAVGMVGGLALWAGMFAYRHIPYDDDLWWKFALQANAPRYLRAALACAVFLAGFALWRLFAPSASRPHGESVEEAGPAIRAIMATSGRTEAMLALTGDKRFLVSAARDAFIMYQVKGSSWVVMGDPVGAEQSWGELLWAIRDLSHRQQGRLMLYEVSPAALDLAIGMGLQIVKYGEEAIVDLPAFELGTPQLRSVRKSERVAAKAGATLRVVPAGAVPVILDELEAISAEWMAAKGHREKGFSLGSFEREYLCNFDVALVMVEGRIVAFANLWLTRDKAEASVDLMRHRADAPRGTMDFLFANLLVWAKARGYRRFTLGQVPLSGIDGRHLAPAWAKAAALVFRHGESFYGFRGLRGYKEKFAPRWEPRYVAGPHGIGLIQGLHDVSRLIGSGPAAGPAAVRHAAQVSVSFPVHTRPLERMLPA